MKKKALALILCLVMVLSLAPMAASAAGPKLLAEFVPGGKLTAPKAPYLTNEPWVGGDLLTLWYNNGPEALAISKAYNLATAADINS